MRRAVKILAKFLMAFAVMTIVSTLAWEVVSYRLFDCTDSCGFDYWQPGNWVHGDVSVVPQVIHGRSMSEPDTIKAGWSVAGLWCLWCSFVALSVIVSFVFSFQPWFHKKRSSADLDVPFNP